MNGELRERQFRQLLVRKKLMEEMHSLLRSTKSADRRKAAKAIRRDRAYEFPDTLLDALRDEIKTPKTWETQYHLIMALAAVNHTAAIDLLRDIPSMGLEYMPTLAAGDASITIRPAHSTILDAERAACAAFSVGVIRGIARLQNVSELNLEAIELAQKIRTADALYWGLVLIQSNEVPTPECLIRLARQSHEKYLRDAVAAFERGEKLASNIL